MIDDTICAIASAPSGALRGVVRISGRDALSILADCLPAKTRLPKRSSRRIETQLHLAAPLTTVQVGVLVWPTTGSYTGQPAAELHLSGSRPILSAAVDRLVQAGARPARPGEFTLRAFLAGRLDLTQAEAVLGVIDADDSASLHNALEQLAGGLGKPLQRVREQLLDLLSHVEAGLDFVEEDIEFITSEELSEKLLQAEQTVRSLQQQLGHRDHAGGMAQVVLRGHANAGKSRLLNALSEQQTAIVAELAGTTRDPVQSVVCWGKHDLRLIDTAGFQTQSSAIEQEAQRLASDAECQADLRLYCIDMSQAAEKIQQEIQSLNIGSTEGSLSNTLLVGTKSDLMSGLCDENRWDWIPTSSVTGAGLPELQEAVLKALETKDREEIRGVAGTSIRCRCSMADALIALERAIEGVQANASYDLVAVEMRLALSAIGEVTGEVYTDDILDRIFGRFCIGK